MKRNFFLYIKVLKQVKVPAGRITFAAFDQCESKILFKTFRKQGMRGSSSVCNAAINTTKFIRDDAH